MSYAQVILGGEAIAIVWLTFSGVGAMVGRLAASLTHRPRMVRSEWTAIGGAVGCAWGFLAMIGAMATAL
jgi:hypothetical protein